MQFYNNNNELIEFPDLDSFMSYLVSNENTNMDIKKGIASIANLSTSEEIKLLNTGNLDIVTTVINKLFKFGSIDSDGNIIIDDDTGTINNIYSNIFGVDKTEEQINELLKYMQYENYTIKRLDDSGNAIDPIVVDLDGNTVTIQTVDKRDSEGNKTPIMIPNEFSIQEWLSQDSKRNASDYPAEIPNTMSALEWLASDSSRNEADYPVTVPNPISLETWLASDSSRAPEDYPTEVYNPLTLEEWLAEDDTRVEEDYPEMVPNSETLTAWLAEASNLDADNYSVEIQNPLNLIQWLADGTNLDLADYPANIPNPQTLIDWLAEETNRNPSDYPITTQQVDENNNLVWETIELDFTITNPLAMENIINVVANKENIAPEIAQFEIEKTILDNADVPSEIVTKYVTSENQELKMKALVHPKIDKTAMFDAVKTDATIPQDYKVGIITAIETPEQLSGSSAIISYFTNLDLTAGTTSDQAAAAELKVAATKKLFEIILGDYTTSQNLNVDVTSLVDLIKL